MLSIARVILLIAVFCQICVIVYSAPPKKYHEWRPLESKEDYYQELIRKVDKDFGTHTPKQQRSTRHLKHVVVLDEEEEDAATKPIKRHHHVRSHHHRHHVY